MDPIIAPQRIDKSVKSLSDADLHTWVNFYNDILVELHKLTPEGILQEPWCTYLKSERRMHDSLMHEMKVRAMDEWK